MRTIELRIIPECYVDTKVTEIVGRAVGKYNHQHGCGDVARELMRRKDDVCLGIVDEDKNKGPRAKYFSEFAMVLDKNNLILQKHNDRQHYLIMICPEIERWLINDALAVEMSPSDEIYKLPENLKDFTSLCKTQDIDKNEGFRRFVKHLINKNAPSISTLKDWIQLFQKNELESLVVTR